MTVLFIFFIICYQIQQVKNFFMNFSIAYNNLFFYLELKNPICIVVFLLKILLPKGVITTTG